MVGLTFPFMHLLLQVFLHITISGLSKSPKAICTKRSEVNNPVLGAVKQVFNLSADYMSDHEGTHSVCRVLPSSAQS